MSDKLGITANQNNGNGETDESTQSKETDESTENIQTFQNNNFMKISLISILSAFTLPLKELFEIIIYFNIY